LGEIAAMVKPDESTVWVIFTQVQFNWLSAEPGQRQMQAGTSVLWICCGNSGQRQTGPV